MGNRDLAKVSGSPKSKVIQAIGAYMNYMRMGNRSINGFTYGSNRILAKDDNLAILKAEISKCYFDMFYEPCVVTDQDVRIWWEDVRKKFSDVNKKGGLIPQEQYPLFDGEWKKPVSVVYAYWGSNQKVHQWLIKIGYTGDELNGYLKKLIRFYDPHPLACKPGDKEIEKKEHRKWRNENFLVEGDEWFCPSEAIFSELRKWDLFPRYEELVEAILRTEKEKIPWISWNNNGPYWL
jgi:hypothetical protein